MTEELWKGLSSEWLGDKTVEIQCGKFEVMDNEGKE